MAGLVFDKFVLFGDSITERAYDQEVGFCVGAALTNGNYESVNC